MANGRTWLTVEPDKTYDLGWVDIRFEVPIGVSFEMMEMLGSPTIRKAIEQFERLGHWQHYDRIPVRYDVSPIPNRKALDRFNSLPSLDQTFRGKEYGSVAGPLESLGDTVAITARVFFIRPLTLVNLDEEAEFQKEMGYKDGYVPLEDMPEDWKNNREQRLSANPNA